MSHLPRRAAGVLAAVLLPLSLLAGLALTARPAAAATTPRVAAGSIVGACSPLQFGEYRVEGRYPNSYIIECVYIPGLGYYWVRQPSACVGAASAAARETAARC